jgi:hypothetical protein
MPQVEPSFGYTFDDLDAVARPQPGAARRGGHVHSADTKGSS